MELRLLGWTKLHRGSLARVKTLGKGFEEVENDEAT